MTPLNGTQQFLPGDPVPFSKAYQEHDPHTWEPVRRLLISRGDVFPPAKREGGFFTLVGAVIEKKRAAAG